MRILYHHRTQAQGAAGTHIREVAKAFEKLGHAVEIISPPFVMDPMLEQENILKVERVKIPQILFEVQELLYNAIGLFNLLRALNKESRDFIYERYAIFNIAGILAAKIKHIPIIVESSFTSKSDLFPKRTRIFSWLAYLSDRFIFNNSNAVIVVSSVLKNSLVNDFKVKSSKIVVLPNAVDEEKFDPAISSSTVKELYGLNNHNIVGFIGGFYPWHGLEMLIDCVPSVLRAFPNTKFLLVGDGALLDTLKQKAKKMQLSENIIFTGRVLHSKLPQYISSFDIGIMPDSNSYGSPMKILEYMSMGKPVVAPKTGPIEEVISHGTDGLLFERNNREELIKALQKLLGDSLLRSFIGKNALKSIGASHTWKNNVSCIVNLVNNTIKR